MADLSLPVVPPVRPMLAKAVDAMPEGDVLFEPKWDGFRCLVFRDGNEVYLQSRDSKPFARYFPELLDPLRDSLPARVVVDGEIVIARDGRLDFDALLLRIHPAESRVEMLSHELAASYVAFDLLALEDTDYMAAPLDDRRGALETAFANVTAPIHLTPMTRDRDVASDWFDRFEGAGFDGVIAKPAGDAYAPNKRTQFKVKHIRSADCVVAGYRVHKSGDGIGSLLLGLFDDAGRLHHVGVASGFSAKLRGELIDDVARFEPAELATHPWADWATAQEEHGQRKPGAQSRWNAGKDLSWTPVRPEGVVEVRYDHLQGDRFRHATHLLRWRTDRSPESCVYDQLEQVPAAELARIFG